MKLDVIYEEIKKHNPDFNETDFNYNYKEGILFYKLDDKECILYDAFMLICREYLYIFEIEEYTMLIEPIETPKLAQIQLSLNNKYVGILKTKDQLLPP